MIFETLFHSGGLFFRTGLKAALLKDRAFKNRLNERDYLVQVKLLNSDKSGYLLFQKGRLKSSAKDCPYPPDLVIEWRDATKALRNMIKIRPRDFVESVHNEISSGRLAVEFDVASSVWFMETMREMLEVFYVSGLKVK